MKKLFKILSVIFVFAIALLPVKAQAEEDVSPVKLDSFVINSEEDEVYNATMNVGVDQSVIDKVNYSYSVAIVTDISQEGTRLAWGNGTTGEDITFDIDMSDINTYSNYRFKILIEYNINGEEGFTYGYTQIFDYTQESYADDLGGRDITVDVSGMVVDISWEQFRGNGQSVLVTVDVDGIVDFEELIPMRDNHYEYFFDGDAKVITVTIKQAVNGLLSKGLTDVINLDAKDKNEFYLEFPQEVDQYDSIWNVKYFNANDQQVKWYTENKSEELVLKNSGSFMVDLEEDTSELSVEYLDSKNIKWLYTFATDLIDYAPTITLLEAYDGSTVTSSNIVLSGKISDANAELVVQGGQVTLNNDGTFLVDLDLKDGKNVFEIIATNKIGKVSRASVTIYRQAGNTIAAADTSILSQYMPLIITASVSILLLLIMFVAIKKRGKKHEQSEETFK